MCLISKILFCNIIISTHTAEFWSNDIPHSPHSRRGAALLDPRLKGRMQFPLFLQLPSKKHGCPLIVIHHYLPPPPSQIDSTVGTSGWIGSSSGAPGLVKQNSLYQTLLYFLHLFTHPIIHKCLTNRCFCQTLWSVLGIQGSRACFQRERVG